MFRRWPLFVLLAAFLLTVVLFAVSQSKSMPAGSSSNGVTGIAGGTAH